MKLTFTQLTFTLLSFATSTIAKHGVSVVVRGHSLGGKLHETHQYAYTKTTDEEGRVYAVGALGEDEIDAAQDIVADDEGKDDVEESQEIGDEELQDEDDGLANGAGPRSEIIFGSILVLFLVI
jgi:hypothetical protein